MNRLKTFQFAFAAFYFIFGVTLVHGQSDHWEDTLISHHVVVSINLNVGRLSQTFEETEAYENVADVIRSRHKIELADIDQFQGFILRDPALGLGADDNSHTQLTFLNPRKFDAESTGALTRYSLHEEQLGGHTAFLGKPDRKGVWGGIPVSKRTVVFGVRRMLKSIVNSQEVQQADTHNLSELRKQDVDICITFSGGKPIAEVFEDAWRTDQFAPTFELFESGLIYFDSQGETKLSATINAVDEESAVKLEKELATVRGMLQNLINFQLTNIDRQIEALKKRENKSILEEVQKMQANIVLAKQCLESIEVSQEGAVLKLESKEEEISRLPEVLAMILIGS